MGGNAERALPATATPLDGAPRQAAPTADADAGAPAPAWAAALQTATSAARGTDPTLPQARLSATPGSAEFAPQLGAQVAVLARDGVHEAQLQLNPADMGPITVQIVVDGSSARVDFQADVAATRTAIENSLPALAGALQDAGLTLAGGGVFQQAPGRQGNGESNSNGQARNSGNGRGGRADGNELGAIASSGARPVGGRGLVDLVA